MKKFVLILACLTGFITRAQSENLIEDFADMIEFGLPDLISQSELIQRNKREVTTSSPNNTQDPLNEAMACVVVQLQQFQDEVRNTSSGLVNLTDKGENKSHQFYSSISPEALDSFCKIYVPRQKEIMRCENSTLRTYITDGFAIFDFICLERLDDFKKQLPCLQKVDSEISTKCTPNCTDKEEGRFNKLSPGNALTSALAQGNDTVEAFKHFCRHLNCLVRCQTPIVKSQCGDPAVKLIHDGIRITFVKLNHLTVATGSEPYWPRACTRLATEDLNKPGTPDDDDPKTKLIKPRMQTVVTYN